MDSDRDFDLRIFIDGACSGNPGEAAVGVVIFRDGEKVKEFSKEIGEATNNIAEYVALVYAMQEALILKAQRVKIYTDSELLFRQVVGRYRVKNQRIKIFFDIVQHLRSGFRYVEIEHIRRERNKEADRLASMALKARQAATVAPMFSFIGEESPSSEG